jgi:hypothetical protein
MSNTDDDFSRMRIESSLGRSGHLSKLLEQLVLSRRKYKKGPRRAGLKRGSDFEDCVAAVAQALSPKAIVKPGTWVQGPDGIRDQDVLIEGYIQGRAFRGIVECKDYDKSKTGPVGIAVVDALDSKRRDLACDLAIVCSNAGFTERAIRKAGRVGISLVGVFREGDKRVRFEVAEYFYFRRIRIERIGFRLDRLRNGLTESCTDSLAATFREAPVANWVCNHIVTVITNNPISAGHYQGNFRFKEPVLFALGDGGEAFEATSLFTEVTLSGGWFEQLGSIDGTAGMYDFIRRRAIVGVGAHMLHFKGLDPTKGTPVDSPPNQELDLTPGAPGDLWMQLLYLLDCNCREPVPPLDDLIVADDLDVQVENLPHALRSARLSSAHRSVFISRNPHVGPNHAFTISTNRTDC